jgi:hypothetical protein
MLNINEIAKRVSAKSIEELISFLQQHTDRI